VKKVLLARFTVDADGAAQVRDLMLDYATTVRAEPGNLLFAPTVLADDPHTYFVYEEYRDDEAFAAHLASEHCGRFNAAIAPWVQGGASTLIDLDPVEVAQH
jgi:quinol monooxygenase YgiN